MLSLPLVVSPTPVKGWRHTVTDEQIRAIVRLKKEGSKITAIAKTVSLSRPTIYRVLDYWRRGLIRP